MFIYLENPFEPELNVTQTMYAFFPDTYMDLHLLNLFLAI